ncbi:MAG: hypothetical protein KGL18_15420 [Burkholderiales bacterium]|nr:hypothetical protein [Burkholderiales bacterium]MDE1926990.1 hypothetical protein [Burkholderiales bacterium]MDE2159880.1 hypothetical protein [Burkholderiales bacterium]MDE2504351.1 hypothetical protein [Burkholderiales bacterium]
MSRVAAPRVRHPGWLAVGLSMASTGLACDTPLLISGIVFNEGLSGNWFWWAGAPGILAFLFFFAPLWRRAEVVTENQLITLRYGDTALTRRYRALKALFDGVVINCWALALEVLALNLISAALISRLAGAGHEGLSWPLVVLLLLAASVYVLVTELKSLVRGNSLQYGVILGASLLIAWQVLRLVPGGLAHLGSLHAKNGVQVRQIWPADRGGVALLLAVAWWHAAPGSGLLVQRVAALRSEREVRKAVLLFAVVHYLLRPWCWYVIGGAALYLLPAANGESTWILLATTLLHPLASAAIGVLCAIAFFAHAVNRLHLAKVSIRNDVVPALPAAWRRLRAEGAAAGGVGLVAVLSLLICGLLHAGGLRAVYQTIIVVLAGLGFVAIARWYWWRTGIGAEIASLIGAIGFGVGALAVGAHGILGSFPLLLLSSFACGVVLTLVGSFGFPCPEAHARAFHERLRPPGPGWRNFAAGAAGAGRGLRGAALGWLATNAAFYGLLIALTALVLGRA